MTPAPARLRMAPLLLTLALVLALLLTTGGAAAAQSCAPEGPGAVRCRFVLSAPQAMRITARARYRHARPAPRRIVLRISVDRRPCLERAASPGWWSGAVAGACTAALPASTHVVEAQADGVQADGATAPDAIEVSLDADRRLAALPREASMLAPRKPR